MVLAAGGSGSGSGGGNGISGGSGSGSGGFQEEVEMPHQGEAGVNSPLRRANSDRPILRDRPCHLQRLPYTRQGESAQVMATTHYPGAAVYVSDSWGSHVFKRLRLSRDPGGVRADRFERGPIRDGSVHKPDRRGLYNRRSRPLVRFLVGPGQSRDGCGRDLLAGQHFAGEYQLLSNRGPNQSAALGSQRKSILAV